MATDEVAGDVEGTGLSLKEEAFARAYGDPDSETFGNKTASAAAAGYGSPRDSGWRAAKRPRVQQRIAELQAEARAAEPQVLANLEHVRRLAIEKGDLATALRATELAGKRLGLFYEAHSVTMAGELERREWDETVAVQAVEIGKILLERQAARELPAASETDSENAETDEETKP